MNAVVERFSKEASPSRSPVEATDEIAYQRRKQMIHEKIVASLDLVAAQEFSAAQLTGELRPFVEWAIREAGLEVSESQLERLLRDLPQEMFGLGPLEALLEDTTVSDVLVNHAHEVFVERHGRLEDTSIVFADNEHLTRIIQRIAASVGRRIDETSPMVDARLDDGSRIHAVLPPLALDGPKLSIRRFGTTHCHLDQLVANGTLSASMADFLNAAVRARRSLLISGGTGAGKTTMLNALSSCIPDEQRIVTIEDSAELRLQHRHVVRLETRPANSDMTTAFTQRDLVRNALRMRPDRIIVGEVRGGEALDMLQAMNTGHEGSMTTIHANDAHDAIARLEMMVAMTGLELPAPVVREYIRAGIAIVVHLTRLPGGQRVVTRIGELRTAPHGYSVEDVFRFRRTGVDADGRGHGEFASGARPLCVDLFQDFGVNYDDSVFAHGGG